jgi:hypothetical protein
MYVATEEFRDLCFRFGIELDEDVSQSDLSIQTHSFNHYMTR